MLDVIAISRGARVRGRFLINFSEEEMLEIATRTGI